jgi:transposase-like protein
MGKTNRNAPERAASSESRYTLAEFDREFPDDAACLDFLVGKLYPDGINCPKCGRVTKHHRIKSRPAYACQHCGRHEYPLVGTIFEGSSTSLRLWFQAIYLMASTRCGISAKQLEREIGVSYPTAWRMFNKIRSLLSNDELLTGVVEIDEAYLGGKAKWRSRGLRTGIGGGTGGKTTVLGFVQRPTDEKPSGRVVAKLAERGSGAPSLLPEIQKRVLPKSTVYTDEYKAYDRLGKDDSYTHHRVNHSQAVYVSGTVHTNSIEGFWSLLRRGIGGTYHSVSTKHLQSYLDEYAFRYNNRAATAGRGMFDAFVGRIEKTPRSS